jgi:hypothetical protein
VRPYMWGQDGNTVNWGWGQSATYGGGQPGSVPLSPGGPRGLPFWQQVFPGGLVKRPGAVGEGLGRPVGAGAVPFGRGQLAGLVRGQGVGPRPGPGLRFPGGRPLPWQLGQGAASHVPTGGAPVVSGGAVPFTPMAALAAFAAQYQPRY